MKTPWPLAVFFTVFVWAALPGQAASLPHAELIQAAQQGKVDRLQALLQTGHDPALRDALGYDALDYAIEWGQFTSAQTLLRHALEQAQSTPALRQAAQQVLAGQVPKEASRPPALDVALLRLAANDGNLAAVQVRLQQGVAPDVGATTGYTALALATRWRRVPVLEALLQAGAGVNTHTATCYQTTALMEATRHGDSAILRRLLDAGARVNEGDRYGDHALNWAVYFGQTEQVQLLVQAGADLTRTGQTDDTPLEIAYRQGHAAIVSYLLARGAKARPGKPGVPPS